MGRADHRSPHRDLALDLGPAIDIFPIDLVPGAAIAPAAIAFTHPDSTIYGLDRDQAVLGPALGHLG